VKLAIIAAIARNRVIGKEGQLPWHIPEDLKRFKRLTSGHTVLMGRKTFDALGQPLSNRRNVVLSSAPVKDVESYRSIPEALKKLENEGLVFVLGGGQIYSQLLERVDYLYLTVIDKDYEGDTIFPEYVHLIGKIFRLFNDEQREGFAFRDFERIAK